MMIGKIVANLLVLAVAALAGYRLFVAYQQGNVAHMKLWGAVLATIVVLLLFVVLPLLGGIRLDADSDKLLVETTTDRRTGDAIIRVKYKDPDSFQDYVFVYDPKDVYFDSYSVNHRRRSKQQNSGRRTSPGVPFPPDAALRMISLPAAANASTTYRQPGSSRDNNFVNDIIVQFFLAKDGKSEDEYAEKLEKFNAILSKGRFMVRKGDAFVDVERSPRGYR
jgi:hypothetical protein